MIDLLIVFDPVTDLDSGCEVLRRRPGMRSRVLQGYTFPWGTAIVQCIGCHHSDAEIRDGVLMAAIGRPVVRSCTGIPAPPRFTAWMHEFIAQGGMNAKAVELCDAVSGMFALFEATSAGVTVLTDHMGFRPVFVSKDAAGRTLGIGTHLESLAAATGQSRDIDPVSVAELFVHNHITFPYTTRSSILELDPGSVSFIAPHGTHTQTRSLWTPTEPERFPDESSIRRDLADALREAGTDLTRGCEKVGVLLSGGIDSRGVLHVIPPEKCITALTYVTKENRETRVASEVARTAGVDHLLVRRGADYFPTLVERGLALTGMEFRGNCHGLCLADNNLCDRFDIVVGGQNSDTLLKDHFMPFAKRHRLKPQSLTKRLKRLIRGESPPPTPNPGHTTGRDVLESELNPDIRRQVRARREARLAEVRRVRPTTADEWHRFWPYSRLDDAAHSLGNARLGMIDTLFAHRALFEVSRRFDPALRVQGRVTDSVYISLIGPLGQITNANTGLPASATQKQIEAKKRTERRARQSRPDEQDWNAVESSWVNPVAMQKHSPQWIAMRERLAGSVASEFLSVVLVRGGKRVLDAYQDDLPWTSNHIAMQLALWLDSLLAEDEPLEGEGTDLVRA